MLTTPRGFVHGRAGPPVPADVIVLLDAAWPSKICSITNEALAEREQNVPVDPSDAEGRDPDRTDPDSDANVGCNEGAPDSDGDGDRKLDPPNDGHRLQDRRLWDWGRGEVELDGVDRQDRLVAQHRRRDRRLDHIEHDLWLRIVHPCLPH